MYWFSISKIDKEAKSIHLLSKQENKINRNIRWICSKVFRSLYELQFKVNFHFYYFPSSNNLNSTLSAFNQFINKTNPQTSILYVERDTVNRHINKQLRKRKKQDGLIAHYCRNSRFARISRNKPGRKSMLACYDLPFNWSIHPRR